MKVKEFISYNETEINEVSLKDITEKISNFLEKIKSCSKPKNIPHDSIRKIKNRTADKKTKEKFKEWVRDSWKKERNFVKVLPENTAFVMAIFPGLQAMLDAVNIEGIAREALIPFFICIAFEAKDKTKEVIERRIKRAISKNIISKSSLREEEELLPNQSSKKDLETIKKLRTLKRIGSEKEIQQFVDRINRVRRSEGLDTLHTNEIISKSVEKDIKEKIKSKKEKQEKKEDKPKKDKKKKDNVKVLDFVFIVNGEVKHAGGKGAYDKLRKEVPETIHIIEKAGKKNGYLRPSRITLNGKEVFILIFNKANPTTFDPDGSKEIVKVKSPYKYRILGNEIRFPEIKKKIVIRSEFIPKIKKL